MTPAEAPGLASAWNLFVVRAAGGRPARDRLAGVLADAGVVPMVHYTPLHRQRPFLQSGAAPAAGLPVTDRIYESSVTLPLYPDLTLDDERRVISAVGDWASENQG